jgi:hypothetical protein
MPSYASEYIPTHDTSRCLFTQPPLSKLEEF